MPNYIGKTHPGLTRTVNEDCCGITQIGEQATLFVVCDGVGGNAGGKQASALALSSFTDFIRTQLEGMTMDDPDHIPLAQMKRMMRAAATDASRRVRVAAQNNPSLAGMASTLVAALVISNRVYVINVGDSRLYTVTEDGVEKITRDHSYIQYLLDIGRISHEQVRDLNIQNYMTQAIGAYDHVDGDFCALDLTTYGKPTYLLLCSDGLYTMVAEDQLQNILMTEGEMWEKAEQLIDAACAGGGTDNITAVLICIE